jgi:hypothetical protein
MIPLPSRVVLLLQYQKVDPTAAHSQLSLPIYEVWLSSCTAGSYWILSIYE